MIVIDHVIELRKIRHADKLVERIIHASAAEIERLRNETDTLRAERDEARRMYCEAVILHGTAHRFDANGVPEEITEAEELARRLKWDCFKEDTND